MADKVQKIREEVERLQNELIQEKEKGFGSDIDDACILELQNVLTYIDSLQEEPCNSCQGFNDKDKCDELVFTHNCPIVKNPVSIWHDASEKSNEPEEVVIIKPSDNTGDVLTRCTGVYQGRIWAYTSELLKLDNPCKIGKNLQEEPVSEDLDAEILKYFEDWYNGGAEEYDGIATKPNLCFATVEDCENIARHFAKWQKKQDQETIELAEDHAMLAGIIKGTEHTIGKVRNILNKVAYRNNGLDVNGDYCEQPYVELDNAFRKLLKEE